MVWKQKWKLGHGANEKAPSPNLLKFEQQAYLKNLFMMHFEEVS